MPAIIYVLAAAFIGLAVIWPLSFFGYHFYHDLITEEQKDAHH